MKNIVQNITAYSKENIYNYDNSIMLNYYPKRIAELLKTESRNRSCLELGLGHGYTARVFSQYFDNYRIVEGSEEVISKFKKENSDLKVEIDKGYFEEWSSNKQMFDVIILGFVLEHVDDPIEIMVRYKGFLKENGKIFITVPNAEALNRRVGVAANVLNDIKELSQNDINLGHKRFYTLDSLRRDVHQAGLNIVREEGIYMKVMSTKQMLELQIPDNIMEGYMKVAKDYPELSCAIMIEATL